MTEVMYESSYLMLDKPEKSTYISWWQRLLSKVGDPAYAYRTTTKIDPIIVRETFPLEADDEDMVTARLDLEVALTPLEYEWLRQVWSSGRLETAQLISAATTPQSTPACVVTEKRIWRITTKITRTKRRATWTNSTQP